MNNPVICIRDASIKNGQLMVKDLFPNRSLANPVVDPAAQGPRYLRVVETATPIVVQNAVSKEVKGLSAYLLATVDAAAGGANLTPVQSDAMASALITKMRAGEALTLNTINTALDGVEGGTGIVGTGLSTATVANILAILGGAVFTLPAATDVNNAYLTEAQQEAKFDFDKYQPIIDEDSSFWISVAKGDLLGLKNSRTVNGVTLDPYVVVYSKAGAVL